ncbi:SlyX family protein [Tichowtungia aerotolerans]|uniref:SlyX protein n=1 Tax=Tichowtungia aerotolerans TaxID=2697043 RepID=A0A6P1MB20_9BACT|nr:SlyX family protein [Tichowtungia aerotolerans]QHI68756.1 SlyX protein [Tichowtungia aerotolerans]
MEDRLTRLEELYSNQTHTIEQMSLEMFQQQREIAALKQQIEALEEKLENSGTEIGGHERPPHY